MWGLNKMAGKSQRQLVVIHQLIRIQFRKNLPGGFLRRLETFRLFSARRQRVMFGIISGNFLCIEYGIASELSLAHNPLSGSVETFVLRRPIFYLCNSHSSSADPGTQRRHISRAYKICVSKRPRDETIA